MKKIICTIFGCSWKYFFTVSDAYSKRTDVRICKYCGTPQYYKQLATITNKEEFAWVDMVGFTKKGAENYWDKKQKNHG